MSGRQSLSSRVFFDAKYLRRRSQKCEILSWKWRQNKWKGQNWSELWPESSVHCCKTWTIWNCQILNCWSAALKEIFPEILKIFSSIIELIFDRNDWTLWLSQCWASDALQITIGIYQSIKNWTTKYCPDSNSKPFLPFREAGLFGNGRMQCTNHDLAFAEVSRIERRNICHYFTLQRQNSNPVWAKNWKKVQVREAALRFASSGAKIAVFLKFFRTEEFRISWAMTLLECRIWKFNERINQP